MDSAGRESETLSIDQKIAIVGIGCRFPGGIKNTNDFWETIAQGLDCVQPHPPERLDPSYIYQGDRIPGKIYTAEAGYLSQDVNEFDREFFQISPEEAHHMDPQLRHLLEVTWEAFEDYGINLQELARSPTGVYIGVMAKEYGLLLTLPDDNIGQYSATGNNSNMLSNRISYQFDLQGPSITFDTACSSSMYAIHHACDAIRKGECNLAIAGGVNLLLLPSTTIALCQARMLAKDGKCKSFDNRADGYSRGEGVGLVVLKSLKKALEDGDRIHAVIRGGAINNDGRTNGITTPNTDAQVSLLKRAYESAQILPQEVPYVEAHGTGTQAGDAAELTAIGRVLGIGRDELHYQPLTIGSVKSNFGHTEGAAGVASVIKVCLVLQKKQIPKLTHFQIRNEKVDWENFQINFPTDSVEWPKKSKYVAGCSSFGFGGANAHLVLEAPPRNRKQSLREDDSRNDIYPTVLFLSASSINALNQKVSDWVDFLKNADADAFHNALQTAAKRATHHQHRLAVICESYQHTIEILQRRGQGQIEANSGMLVEGRVQKMYNNRTHQLAFVFSGMGTQWWAMGRQLMVSEEIFSNCIEEIDKLLKGFGAEWSLQHLLTKETDKDKIHRTDIAQPAICAIQIALAAVYRHLGIHPDVVIGHSVGEVAAAYVAGYLSLSDAIRLIYVRGKSLQKTTGKGKMAAILSPVQNVSEAIAKPEYEGKIDIACINSRSQTVVSGEGDAIEKLIVDLEYHGIRCIPLKVNNAFHSFQQEFIKQYFLKRTNFLRSPKFPLESKLAPIHVKMISTVNGKYLNAEVLNTKTYWWNNIRQTVAFEDSLVKVLESGCNVFLEIGPHPSLASPIKDTMVSFSERSGVSYHDKFSVINSLRRPSDTSQMPADQINIHMSVAKLYVQGFPIQMNLIFPSERFSVATLPKYPWQRKQYSAIADAARKTYINPRNIHPLLGEQLVTYTSTQQNNPNKDWISNYSRLTLPWLHHHKIQNAVVLPGAAFIETMIAASASSENCSIDEIHLTNVQFHKFHYSPKSEGVLFTSLRKLDERDKTEICIRTRNKNDNSWTLNATCDLDLSSALRTSLHGRYIDLDEIQSRCDTSIPCDTLYDKLAEGGVQIGDMFASVTSAHYSTTTQDALVFASLPRAIEKESQLYMFHPALLDAIFQLFAGFAVLKTDKTGLHRNVEVPQAVKSFRILSKAPKDIVIHARKNDKGTQEVRISDYESGKIFAELDGVILAVVGSKQNGGSISWEKEWVAVDYEGGSQLLERSNVPEKLEYFLIPDKDGVTKKLKNLLHNTHKGRLNEIHVCDTSTDAESLPSPDINAWARHVVFMQMIDECSSLNGITKETFIDSQVNKAIACIQSTLIQSIEHTENVFFWIVTKGAVLACPSDNAINPLMSKALALVLTCMNEHPDIFVAAIDLPHDLSPVNCALCLSYFFDNPLLSENCLALRIRNDSVNESNIELYALRLNTKPTADLVFTKKSQEWMINLDEITQKERGHFIRPWDKNISLGHNDIGSTCSNQQIVVEAYIQQPYKSLGDTHQSKSGFLFAGQVLRALPSSDTEEKNPAFVGFCRSHIVTSVVQTSMSNIVPVPLNVRPLDALVTVASCLPIYIALKNTFQNSDHHIVLLTSGNDPLHVKLIQLLSNSTGCNIQLAVSNVDRKEKGNNSTDGSIPFVSLDDLLSAFKSSSIDTLIVYPNVTIDDKKMTPLLEKLRFFGTLVTFCSGTWKHPLIINHQITVKTVDLEILRSFDHYQFLNGSITSLLQLFFPDNGDSYLMCPSSANISSINDASGIQLCGESVVCTNHTIPVEVSYRFGDSMMAFEAETFASYLVVGGSKGLGFEIVRWLANQGAKVVYFSGRSSPDGDIADEVKRLRNMLHTLEFIKCDASDEYQTTQMLSHIKDRSKYPLRGIFHCAALFADQRLQNARREDWCKVVLPKAYGALLLHQITQKLDIKLRQFVVFSSIVEFLGNDGQGSYCCANAFLTSLCLARRLEGLPATVIAPGAVSSVGFAAREGFVQLFEARGMYGVNPAEVVKSLSWSLGTDAMFGLSGFLDRQLYVRANPLFTHFIGKDHFSIYKKEFPRQLLEDIALSSQNIILMPSEVTDFFVQFVENRLGVTEGISSETSLGFYGLDSAMSWELSALIMSRYNVAVSAVELLNESLKMSDLAILVCDRSSGSEGNERQRENKDPFTSSGTLWLQELGQLENANTDIVCFPCTGKGASMFDHWVAIFALENVRLTVAQLPGWEGRMNEKPSHNLEYLVQELSSCFLTKFKQNRVAFVGCGIGALLAFEVALKLQSQHGFHICHMFVVGWYPPSSPYPVEMMQSKEDKNKQSDIEKMALRFLDNRDLKQVQIFKKSYSNVQASNEICRLYKRMNNTPLLCDMTVFNGNKDPILIPKLVDNWRGEIHENHSFQRIQIKTDYKLLRNKKSNLKIASTIRNTLVGRPTMSRSTTKLNC